MTIASKIARCLSWCPSAEWASLVESAELAPLVEDDELPLVAGGGADAEFAPEAEDTSLALDGDTAEARSDRNLLRSVTSSPSSDCVELDEALVELVEEAEDVELDEVESRALRSLASCFKSASNVETTVELLEDDEELDAAGGGPPGGGPPGGGPDGRSAP